MKHSLLVLILAATLCHGQGTFTVTFEEPPMLATGEVRGAEEYVESGMRFRELYGSAINDVARMRGPYGSFPDNGTVYFGGSTSVTNVTSFSLIGGNTFTLLSVELADFHANDSDKLDAVRFIGHRSDGSTVIADIVLQHLVTGGRADFQTSNLGPEFTDVSWVEIPTHHWWMDNLVFSIIPEPTALVLFGFGSLLLGATLIRKRR